MSLVFSYDMSNPKSWKGRPTTNYLVTSSFGQTYCMGRADKRPFNSTSHSANGKLTQGTGFTFTPGQAQNIPEKPVDDCEIWYVRDSNPDHYSRFSPFNGINTSSDLPSYDVSYVVSSYVYLPPNVTLGNANNWIIAQNDTGTDWHTGGTFDTASYNSTYNFWARRTGSTSSTVDTNLRGVWQRMYVTFTTYSATVTQEAGVTINRLGGYFRPNLVGQSQQNYYFVAASQLELGTTPSPYVYGSRSNTEALLDLTRTYTATVTSLTYNSDGTFSFGNGDYIDLPSNLGYTTTVSCFAWFKSNGTPTGGYHIVCGGQELEISVPTSGELRTGVYTNTRFVSNHGSGLTDGNWHYIGFTFDGSTKTAYIDGESVGTLSTTGTLTSNVSDRRVGRFGSSGTYYANADIAEYSVYNNVLTPTEIKNNFERTKHKYI